MKRRDFVKKSLLASAAPLILNSIPIRLMSGQTALEKLAANSCNDNILVILQMHGGNDGINTLVPMDQLDSGLYQFVRPNIALGKTGTRGVISLDSTLGSNNVGLHPDMIGMKNLYDAGKLAVVQGVSYEHHNQSHFRSRDIMFMGGGYSDYLNSGWVGRYLQNQVAPKIYPDDFPNTEYPDPLALEFGNEISLIFHQGNNIPTSISINDPQSFFDLVNELPGFDDKPNLDPRGIPPSALDGSLYTQELNWILGLEGKTEDYHTRLLETYNAGKAKSKGVSYPEKYPYTAPSRWLKNPLSGQLQIVANLIDGGSKTKVYLLKIGGFDTHASQTIAGNATMGVHATLLYHISSAMQAFQEDLKQRGIDDRVLTVTTSEFGRRIQSNGSYGTDHGIGGPTFVFGKYANPGVLGTPPDLNEENVQMQYDYRQIYATILKDWFCVDATLVDSEFMVGTYQDKGTVLPLIDKSAVGVNDFIVSRFRQNACYPNPAKNFTTFSFYSNGNYPVTLTLNNLQGQTIKTYIANEMYGAGEHQFVGDLTDVQPGSYVYTLKIGSILNDTKKLVVL
ncbi:MAG: DUF1501 domain-containing protein [Cytophagales bacterium]